MLLTLPILYLQTVLLLQLWCNRFYIIVVVVGKLTLYIHIIGSQINFTNVGVVELLW